MKTFTKLPKILGDVFWSLVYTILIVYAAKFLWDLLADIRLGKLFKDLRINRRIRRAIEAERRGESSWQ